MAAPTPAPTPGQQQLGDVGSVVGGSELVAPTMASPAIGEGVGTANIVDEEPFVLHGQNGILSGNNTHVPPANLEMDTADGAGHYTLVEDHIDRVCVGEGSPGIPSYNWIGAWHDGRQEITVELKELWDEISSSEGDLKLYERILLFCELPFTVLRKVRVVTVFSWKGRIMR